MEILELPSLRPRVNITTYRTPPMFTARGLDDATSYRIMLYAVNAKGRSDPTIIDPVTFKGVAKLQGKDFFYYLSISNYNKFLITRSVERGTYSKLITVTFNLVHNN